MSGYIDVNISIQLLPRIASDTGRSEELMVDVFHFLVICHIITGAIGIVAFWVPVTTVKGGSKHVLFGRIFAVCMLMTGTFAIGISTSTLLVPLETHPAFDDAALVRGIFGWMMLYLALLTINLAWFGWQAAWNKRDHAKNWEWRNLVLQVLVTVTAVNCLVQGILIGQVLMIGISFVGFATVATNMWFLMKEKPGPRDWMMEHIKAIVGAGISVYTAFLAFGAVRFMPSMALSPALWAVPLITGISLIVYHQRRVRRRGGSGSRGAAAASGIGAESAS
ncbi:hypothetical protein ACFQ14_15645 [Pseudahrensia aquimaris]|uniref:DUF2306 domain-containing protein n=1 Tax=Pseudahrensia aquimaris TaxID=744461 RepID=A0ABW3FJY6_9HYPH